MPPAISPVLQPGGAIDPVSISVNISTNWQPSKPFTCLSKLHCDLDKPEPRLGGAFEIAARRVKELATLNSCKLVAYTVTLKDEWTRVEAFAPPPGSGSCAFAFVHEDSNFVTLQPELEGLPRADGEKTEDTAAQRGVSGEAEKAAEQATETAPAAAPSDAPAATPTVPSTSWCANGLLGVNGVNCCATSCGRCGGDGCNQLPGGEQACCSGSFASVLCSTPEQVACVVPPPSPSPLPPSSPVSVSLYKTLTGMNSWYEDRPACSTDCEWQCQEDPRCIDYRFDVVHASCALFGKVDTTEQTLSLSLLAEPTRQTKPKTHARPQRLIQRDQTPPDGWILIEVSRDNLPWPVDNYRRNSRVPKLLPHLFFPPTVDATVYIDAENSVSADIHSVVQSMLFSCKASFAAQTSPSRAVSVMKEFEVVRYSKNAVEPEACEEQEHSYRADKAYMAAVNAGRAVGINAELLVRRNLNPFTRLLGNSWMRAYLRGGDRDQPAFSYAFEQSVMKACRAQFEQVAGVGAHKTGYIQGQCGLGCGMGHVNLVGSARSADCLGDNVKTYCDNQPEGYCEVKPRPWWATKPPDWVCNSKL